MKTSTRWLLCDGLTVMAGWLSGAGLSAALGLIPCRAALARMFAFWGS
jgi:hypothetical protein